MTTELDIATYLASKGRGTLPAAGVVGTIFTTESPPLPDATITVASYAGQPPERMSSGAIDKPSFQIRVRGLKDDPTIGRALIETIAKDLDGLGNVSLSGTYYLSIISAQSDPTYMGRDENGRPEWVWNFYTSKLR
nr:minor capsid protein [uncultured Methanoregula sp.]